MKLNVQPLFTGEREQLLIDEQLDFSARDFFGSCPFRQPVSVKGTVTAAGGVVLLRAIVGYRFDGQCDRCLDPFSREGTLPIEHVLVTSAEDEDSDELVVLEDFQLDLDELVETDLWLELPSKSLCREDCRGLCPQCGKNLNEGLCGCGKKDIDPRLEALKQALQ